MVGALIQRSLEDMSGRFIKMILDVSIDQSHAAPHWAVEVVFQAREETWNVGTTDMLIA